VNIKLRILSLFLLFLFSFLFSSQKSFASTYTLSGKVSDNSGGAIVGATVTVNDTNND
jgi:hypothetical protein